MAGGVGNSQSLPYRQPNKKRKRYVDAIASKSDIAQAALKCLAVNVFPNVCSFAVTVTELQENTEALKTKMSELRLYCDLLLQQVNKIKENDELGDAAEVRLRFE